MKEYNVPQDMSEQDKIVGGILTLPQTFWVGVGVVIGLAVFFTLYKFAGFIGSAIIAFPFMGLGLPFAFYKKNQLTLFDYLIKRRNFKSKNKKLNNIRSEEDMKW